MPVKLLIMHLQGSSALPRILMESSYTAAQKALGSGFITVIQVNLHCSMPIWSPSHRGLYPHLYAYPVISKKNM